MAKMKNLTVIEEEMFRFLKNSFGISPRLIKPELEKFLYKIKHLEKDRFQTRAFAYLDVISWLEAKVNQKSMAEIIYEKYKQSKRRLPSNAPVKKLNIPAENLNATTK